MEPKLITALDERTTNTTTGWSNFSLFSIDTAENCKVSIFTEHSKHHKFVHGFVKFDFANVCVPGLGNIHVKSEFPRLKPKHERKFIEDCDVEALCSKLMRWANDNFEIAGREEYFKMLTLSSIYFSVHIHPITELYSEEMFLCLIFFFFLFYIDDIIEDAIKNKIPFKEFKNITEQFQSILIGKYDNNATAGQLENVSNYPDFDQVFVAFLQMHKSWKKFLPDYEHRVKPFANAIQRYFGSLLWYCIDEIDERYSEESFKAYRKHNAFIDGSAEILALLHGVAVSDAMSNSLTMKRLLDAVNAIGAYTNDLLGMKNDFANEKDNLIVFMVIEKKIPLDEAVRQVCEIIADELIDYDLLKRAILKEFDYDDNLNKYLDIIDSVIDGHNMLYIRGMRYRSGGSVSLTR